VSYEPNDEVKEKKLVTLNNEVIPFYLEKLDDIARENGGFLSLGRVYNVLITSSLY
jgi:glutathione S-transferase